METQFTWIIEQMQCAVQQDGEKDVVVTAFWRCNGAFLDFQGTVYGSCGFAYTGGDFTPYDQLTQDQVLGWCWNSGVDKDATQLAVEQQIQQHIAPTVQTLPNPWQQAAAA